MNRGSFGYGKYSSSGLSPAALGLAAVMVLSLLTALGGFIWVSNTPPESQKNAPAYTNNLELVDVLIPIERIEAGTPLEAAQFRKESRPVAAVGPSHVEDFTQIRNTYAASFIAANQPLLAEYVTSKRPVNPIESSIPDGYRAVTMATDITTGVEGWARPGAKVDVVLASSINGKSAATVVVQNAKVLSTGANKDDKEGHDKGPQTVTLMVTVDEAAKIQLAASSGQLSLALRGDEDTIESPVNTTITVDSILNTDAGNRPAILPSEGKVRIDGRQFLIVNGKLVPDVAPTPATK